MATDLPEGDVVAPASAALAVEAVATSGVDVDGEATAFGTTERREPSESNVTFDAPRPPWDATDVLTNVALAADESPRGFASLS
ncbi:MAG: hypothetical protein QM784_06205 [Polyangiaceae bacterium]